MRQTILAGLVTVITIALIVQFVSAQIAIDPTPLVCQGECMLNDCYSYKDCTPIKGTCKIGNCCEGECTIVPSSPDEKVNYISYQLVDLMKEIDTVKKSTTKPSMQVHGTEYTKGDDVTTFLQLLDDENHPISNSTCLLTLFYPNKTAVFRNNVMTSLNEEGLYYYDMTAPSTTGIYMASAKCYIPELEYNITMNVTQTENWESGDFSGGNGWSESSWTTDGSVGTAVIDADSPYNGTYHLRIKNSDRYAHRGFVTDGDKVNITFYAKVNSFESNDDLYVQFWDGSYKTIYTFNSSHSDNAYYRYSFLLTDEDYNIGTNILRFKSSPFVGEGDYFYADEITIISGEREYYDVNETEYQVVRGSGELHVFHHSVTNLTEIAIENIWNFENRSLTQYCCSYVGGTEYSTGELGIVSAQLLKAGSPVNDGTCDVSIYYPDGTKFIENNLTTYLAGSDGIYRFNFTAPNITGVYDVDFKCVKGGFKAYSAGDFHVSGWANTIHEISTKLDNVNASLSAENQAIISLINALNDISVADVWSYTGSPSSVLLNNIAQAVWNYVARYTHGIII